MTVESALLACIESAVKFSTSAPAITEPDDKGKRKFTGWQSHERAPTIDDVKAHLSGDRRLHAPPTDRWCQIDIDHVVPDEDMIRLCQRIDKTTLVSTPVVTRTKSGGAHIDLLFVEPVDTKAVIDALMKCLGLSKEWRVETFDTSTTKRISATSGLISSSCGRPCN